MLFLTRFAERCQQFPNKSAITYLDSQTTTITYARLAHTIELTMGYLQSLGVKPGDRVAVQLPKCLPFIYLHFAIMRLGAITLPLNPGYPATELSYFLADAGAELLFAAIEDESEIRPIHQTLPTLSQTIYLVPDNIALFADLIADADTSNLPALPTEPKQAALMIYTSGTTGRPKGAVLSHLNLTANLDSLHEAWGWRTDDVLMHVLPIFHLHGLMAALHGALHAGATTIMLPKFDAEATLSSIVKHRCTVLMAVPTIHKRLLECPTATDFDLSHMRLLTSGSDRLPEAFFHRFRDVFGHTLLERYGMTETGLTISNPLHGERRVGSIGLPLPGVEVRIANPETEEPLPDGEIGDVQVRGAHVFDGYWGMPDKTAETLTHDGWIRSGDLGLREPDGYISLKGRSKDLIISGGLNIYPPEVELVIAEIDGVVSSAVIGCTDEEWGERVVAVVVLADEGRISAEAIIQHCREHLAPYKCPRKIIFQDELPRNAIGKIQKAILRKSICAE